MSRFHPNFEDLPHELAIFPLPGVLMLPGQVLPLNIFEERYIQLIEDVMGQGRMIGMIQPRHPDEEEIKSQIIPGDSPLYSIGCMGRVTHFEETSDGRFGVQLRGVSRFTVMEEMQQVSGYRRAKVSWLGYEKDLMPLPILSIDRTKMADMSMRYFDLTSMNIDRKLLEHSELELLIDALCMICPFGPVEKQALLEADGLPERADMLMALMEMALAENDEDAGSFGSN